MYPFLDNIQNCVESIKLAYLSGVPVVWIVTKDKEVAEQIAVLFAEQHIGSVIDCDPPISIVYKSIAGIKADFFKSQTGEPALYFNWIADSSSKENSFGPDIKSQLEIFINFYYRLQASAKVVMNDKLMCHQNLAIIASPEPPALGWLNRYIETIYVAPISDAEINEIINRFCKAKNVSLDKSFIDQLIVNFRGISEREINQLLARCLVSEYFDSDDSDSRNAVLSEIRALKRRMLEGFKGLKWIEIDNDSAPAAGLGAITTWLRKRIYIFSDPERMQREGYDIPKGLIVTGIPGTGKSLMAKETARILNLPLIAMDLGDIQEGLVGKSEEHMADALRMVDAMAPCVLWIDEIEKAFSGADSGKSDGGVMRRMFGKFLTWMQEKKSFSFVFATSNDITCLPPELFRSERFDEKFYNFMPDARECAAIFTANIRFHNDKFRRKKGPGQLLFDAKTFEKEDFWLNILNNWCTCNYLNDGTHSHEEVRIDTTKGLFSQGYIPQKKLFTGADISAFVKALKFMILSGRDDIQSLNYGASGPITKAEAEKFIPILLADFMPYGQTNLADIAKCFFTLAKNRFRSASGTETAKLILSFDEYSETEQKMKYDPERFSGDDERYNRTLYRCVVGAINNLAEQSRQQNRQQ